MAQNNQRHQQDGRTPPQKTVVIDFGDKQRDLAEKIQHDEGYAATLRRELEQVERRLIENKGKLDLIAELVHEYKLGPELMREETMQAPKQLNDITTP